MPNGLEKVESFTSNETELPELTLFKIFRFYFFLFKVYIVIKRAVLFNPGYRGGGFLPEV